MNLEKVTLILGKTLSAFYIAFITMFFLGEMLSSEASNFNNNKELILFAAFPLGVYFGLLYSWINPLRGGAITCISILIFHLLDPNMGFNVWIDGIFLPGILFLVAGCMKLKNN
jgi:hypothetical protein